MHLARCEEKSQKVGKYIVRLLQTWISLEFHISLDRNYFLDSYHLGDLWDIIFYSYFLKKSPIHLRLFRNKPLSPNTRSPTGTSEAFDVKTRK